MENKLEFTPAQIVDALARLTGDGEGRVEEINIEEDNDNDR